MQFSLAAGSESTARKEISDPIMKRHVFDFNPHVFQVGDLNLMVKLLKGSLMANRHKRSHTYAFHEGGVEAVGEQRLRKLPEVQLQCSRDGVDVHIAQHHQNIFGIYRSDRQIESEDATLLKTHNNTAALSNSRNDIISQ